MAIFSPTGMLESFSPGDTIPWANLDYPVFVVQCGFAGLYVYQAKTGAPINAGTGVIDCGGGYAANLGGVFSLDGTRQVLATMNGCAVENAAAPPDGIDDGTLYFNVTDKHFYGWNGTEWKQLDNA